MYVIFKFINFIFNIIFVVLKIFSDIWALILISVVTGIVMLLIFKATSNQTAIKKTKDRIKAHILELVLYKDNFKVIIKAIGNIFRYNGLYLRQTIIPLLIVFLPVVLILIQLNYRYQFRDLRKGERALVRVKLDNNLANENLKKIKLLESPNYIIETPTLAINEQKELDWRIQVLTDKNFNLLFENEGDTIKKSVNRKSKLALLSPKRQKFDLLDYLFCPTEEPISKEKLISSIEITYPHNEINILGINIHWLVIFFVVSLIAAFGLKGIFHVEI